MEATRLFLWTGEEHKDRKGSDQERFIPSSSMGVSRLNVVKRVDMNTPLCVLEEILDAHRIGHEKGVIRENYRKELIDYIHKLPSIPIDCPLEMQKLRILTAYVNTDRGLSWTKTKLFEALHFLQTFEKSFKIDLSIIDPKFESGLQTPDNTHKLNACVLYRICQEHNLSLNVNTTISMMANAVRFLITGPDKAYQLLNHFSHTSTVQDVIDVLILGNPSAGQSIALEKDNVITKEKLSEHLEITAFVNNNNTNIIPIDLLKRIEPKSCVEAVALTAVIFKRDISLSSNPICEYKRLQSTYFGYIPYDEELRKIHILNPTLLDLRKTFNPLFPEEYYRVSDLISMAVQEGNDENDIDERNVYNMLQLSQLLENFYSGLYPEITNKETPVTLDEVEALDPGVIVCYGVRREFLTAFHIEGLIDHFRVIKTFAHPIDPGITFTPQAIKKLKSIAQDRFSGTERSQVLKRDLLEVIEEVEFLSAETLSKAKEFYDRFLSSTNEDKLKIRETVLELLHLAMYMRGWDGKNPHFPIREAPVHDQLSVDIKVTSSIQRFETLCSNLNHIGILIRNLPLLRYQGVFNPSRPERDGLTIDDRLRIVKEGNNTGNMASCIRMTSNWLAASAYRYWVLIGEPAPFTVEELREIS